MPASPNRKTQSVACQDGNILPYSLAEARAHVRLIARQACGNQPAQAEFEDLVSEGLLGLVKAAHKFDPKRGILFRTYAEHRIRGAIRDSLRRLDPLSRSLRRRNRAAEKAIAELAAKLKRQPTEAEIAKRLNIPLARWRRLERELHDAGCPVNGRQIGEKRIVQVETLPGGWRNPEQEAADGELQGFLRQALADLTAKEREILVLRYREEWTLERIGEHLGVSPSRVSQMHVAILRRLRTQLEPLLG